ncbi:MAG: N-acetyltransferase [Azospira sp.]|jgi:ribosomal protein S18 acetylase RimI-like enzyme|nr:N-acetyltransferase [Azospira sp.]
MKIRRASLCDLQDIARIQGECYSDRFIESKASFAAKLTAHPDFSFVAFRGELAVGYVFALPWVFGSVPDLNGLAYSIPPDADSLYIHDIAVGQVARRAGLAERLLDSVLEAGREKGFGKAFLVAVQGASSYWQRHGFEAVQPDEALQHGLSAYGEGATCMAKPIAATPLIERISAGKPAPAAHVEPHSPV